ncbi:MAG: hypothetical protein ACI4FZ_04050 [Lachnospiraceae bacterium]
MKTTFERAREFIYRNARPLDLARFQYHFENGSKEAVIHALSYYQNEDGGFGHALEADCWNPESSPIQTWTATEIIREIDLKEKDHPVVQGILRYLESTNGVNGHGWPNTIPSNDRYPHAPWWNYSPAEEIDYNPTASLIGFILRYAKPDSNLYRTAGRLLKEAYAYFKKNCPLESMHTASCFVELYEDLSECGLTVIDLKEFERLLHMQIAHVLTADTSVWATEYVCKPSLLIHSRNSRFYVDNKKLCDYECRFLSKTQDSDGTWAITWDWAAYPEQWHISKNWWKADLILKNLTFYRNMQE